MDNDRFKYSTTRSPIMDGLESVVAELEGDNIKGDLWINGSFVTEKIDPNDVDVVLRVDGVFADRATAEQSDKMDWFEGDIKTTYHVHSFIFPYYPESHPRHWYGEYEYARWLNTFGFNRPGTEHKGIVVIQTGR